MTTCDPYIYLNTLCKEDQAEDAVNDILAKRAHLVLDTCTTGQGKRWKSVIIKDPSITLELVQELDNVRHEYPKLRYLLLVEDEKAAQKGQFRVHVNRRRKKVVTLKAKKRIGLRE